MTISILVEMWIERSDLLKIMQQGPPPSPAPLYLKRVLLFQKAFPIYCHTLYHLYANPQFRLLKQG